MTLLIFPFFCSFLLLFLFSFFSTGLDRQISPSTTTYTAKLTSSKRLTKTLLRARNFGLSLARLIAEYRLRLVALLVNFFPFFFNSSYSLLSYPILVYLSPPFFGRESSSFLFFIFLFYFLLTAPGSVHHPPLLPLHQLYVCFKLSNYFFFFFPASFFSTLPTFILGFWHLPSIYR